MVSIGDLVTVKFGENNISSNTYKVVAKDGEICFLTHPIAPECFISRKTSELNTVAANLKSPIEKCIEFVNSKLEYLSFNNRLEFESLKYFFLVKRSLTSNQKAFLAKMCGKISKIKMESDVNSAAQLVLYNVALLDDFNSMIFNKLKKRFENTNSINNEGQRITIFNMAGFILAQLQE